MSKTNAAKAPKFTDLIGTDASTKRRPIKASNSVEAVADSDDDQPMEGNAGENRWQNKGSYWWAGSPVVDSLEPGLYRPRELQNIGLVLDKIDVETDDLMILPDSSSNAVLDEIKQFWELEPEFKKRGFIHKRGVLLWGPPGSGKTSTIQQLVALVIQEYGGIAVFSSGPAITSQALHMIRSVEKKRPIIVLLEDLDALIDSYGENDYLALLDGETQVANVVFVATTNYPQKLDRRFIDRPSRFDLVKFIGMPSEPARRAYLSNKEESLTEQELDYWASKTEGFSIAHLRELIILCKCYGKDVDAAIDRLEEMRESKPSDFANADDGRKSGFGFTR